MIIFGCFLLALVLFVRSSMRGFPSNAKPCDGYYISCLQVKKGMYHCKIFNKERELVSEKTCIYPVYYTSLNEKDLSHRITKYDGDTVYFDTKRKLIVCSVPEDAERVQCLDGGAWVSCRLIDPQEKLYSCIVYSAEDGSVLSEGTYVLKKFFLDENAGKVRYTLAGSNVKSLEPVYYGGIGISMKGNMVLMPSGWIEYPQGTDSRLRVKYNSEGDVLQKEEYRISRIPAACRDAVHGACLTGNGQFGIVLL